MLWAADKNLDESTNRLFSSDSSSGFKKPHNPKPNKAPKLNKTPKPTGLSIFLERIGFFNAVLRVFIVVHYKIGSIAHISLVLVL